MRPNTRSVLENDGRLRKRGVSGSVVGASVQLPHEHLDLLLGFIEAGFQRSQQADAPFILFQAVFELETVAFEARDDLIEFGHSLAKRKLVDVLAGIFHDPFLS